MAEPEQETELLDRTVPHSLSHDTDIVDVANEHVDNDGMSEELLSQALAEANAFDASTISYTVTSEESCDTVYTVQLQNHACVDEDLTCVDDPNEPGVHISANSETVRVHSSESVLTNTPEAIFTNGTDSFLSNRTSLAPEVLGVESNNETFTVDVGSLPEGHIISIPNDIMSGSVIVSQSNEEQFQQPAMELVDETQPLQDDTHQIIQQIEPHYVQNTDNQIVPSDSDSHLVQSDTFMQPHTITVSAASGMTLTPEVLQSVIQQIQSQQLAQQQAVAQRKQSPVAAATTSPNTVSFTLVSPSQRSAGSPPLGSSQNPIRIIQQGNRYTPMQQLTSEQLQQIMQVVQQQHVNKNTQENGGAVIFNPQTNTRIMYRVIYPCELHKTQNGTGHTTYQVVRPSTSSQEQQTGAQQQKRPYRKRKDIAVASGVAGGEEEDKEKNTPDAPELSKEEKEERKKHRPRTRSGRVSKPPKHMVQDYKRIHVLDWDEDYDDSDGGYSDFKHSDEEAKVKQEGEEEHSTSPEFFQALGAGRPKNHKCQTCDKSYIGQAGLARHYRLNPDHCTNPTENGSISSLHNGSIDGDDSKDASLLPDGSSSRMSDSAVDMKANFNTSSIENISEDSNTQDSLNSTGATSPVIRRGRGRGGFRGRWAHLKHNAQIRRKNKLTELIKQCTDEDLMEVVLPRLVNSVSLWEYLMMKSENGGARPQVDVIYHEFEALRQHVKQACADYMQPLTWEELEDDNLQCKMIKVSDKNLAVCLNLDTVTYRVKEMPPGESNSFSSLHNRLSSTTALDTVEAASVTKNMSIKNESTKLLSDVNVKRLASSVHGEESATKRAKMSTISSPVNNIQATSSTSVSLASLYTVTASLPLSTENKVGFARSESTMSSLSSSPATSQQTAQQRGQSSAVTSLSSSSSTSQSIALTSKYTSTSTNVRSPYIHISCPTTKQPPASYTLAGPKRLSPASNRATKSQPVPVVISQPALVPGTKAQMLPYIVGSTSSSLTGLNQKLVLADSENQTIQTGTVPIVFAAPISQQSSTATVLLTSESASSGHRVLVRQPGQAPQGPSHVILSNQSPSSRSLKGNLSTSAFYSSTPVVTTQTPALCTKTRSLLGVVKPTEVRVSRQLFHDTTSPSVSSSALTNGHSTIRTVVTSSDLPHVLNQFHPASIMVSSNGHSATAIDTAIVSSNHQMLVKPGSNKTLLTPPSGQQFATSPNKTVLSSQIDGVDDISVLTAMGLSGEDLGTLNTSSDSLNVSLSGCTHLTDSIMTEMAANSSVSHSADDPSNLVDMVQMVNSDSQVFDTISKASLGDSNGILLMNGSSPSYMKTKHCNIINQMSSLSSQNLSSSLTLSDTPDYMMSSKAAKLVSPMSQDSSSIVQSVSYQMGTHEPDLKSDISMNSSIMMSFTEQAAAQIIDGVSEHLGGMSQILASDELPDNTTNILSEPVSCSENQEADGENMDLSEAAVSDSLTGDDDGQLLLSEGTNIYQTEDGTFIIQKANGNTYQLQGAQGFSLEAVQALLSGTLDQLAMAGDGLQTDVNLH